MQNKSQQQTQDWTYEVIKYQDMIQKDHLTSIKALDQLKRNRMIVISEVPGIKEIRKNHFKAAQLLQVSHQNKQCFSQGVNCYDEEIISHFSKINSKKLMNYFQKYEKDPEEFPDISIQNDWKNIEFLKQSTDAINKLKLEVAIQFIELIENLQESGLSKAKEKISINISQSQQHLSRTIYYTPQQQIRKQQKTIYPHYDCEIFSVHNKDFYVFNNQNVLQEDIQPPQNTGLFFRNSFGQDFRLILKDDEIMIQNGLPIQLLSGKQLQAQSHWVQDSQQTNIGRISHILFLQPKLETLMQPLDDSLIHQSKQLLEINDVDKNIISELISVNNHWYEGVDFAEFIQNQRNQYNFIINLKKLDYPVKHNLKSIVVDNKKVSIYSFDQIDSTHTLAEKWSSQYLSKNKIFVFRADQQKQGRGQNQNSWSSPPGNLYITYLMKANDLFRLSLLPQTIALAVKNTIQNYTKNEQVQLKWINDVFVQGKKIAGILITSENIAKENYYKLAISVGVNLNVNPLGDKSTSLLEVTKKKSINVEEFSEQLTKNIIRYSKKLIEDKHYTDLKHELNQSLKYQNEKVEIWDEKFTKVMHKGVFKGVNDYGQAILERETRQIIISEGRMRSRKSVSKKRLTIIISGILLSAILAYHYINKKKS